MEQPNTELKQTLIQQYSKLNCTSEAKLANSLNEADWWEKEQVNVIRKRKLTLICSVIVWVCFLVVVASGLYVLHIKSGMLTTSFFALLTLYFSSFTVLRVHSRNEERIKLFEIMKLVYIRKGM